ncbi:site-specific integrase [Sphingomonas crocodyli]|uniref:Site-specific integrase n=1 Tax=Sphingomonas crocodyli TaxID=1979270 RepID=A0A437M593_9SPHN|nr:site-specific integrase [Sphingomonas crocodyli]RVT92839.1 site-specific integrase [Sphingomonas crocodyli]
MGLIVNNRHIQKDPATGRLSYRRAFEPSLRPFLAKPRRELKVSLGSTNLRDPKAERKRLEAEQQYEREVRQATAARRVAMQEASGRVDRLTPELVQYLIVNWQVDDLALDEEVRWAPRSRDRKLQAQADLRAHVTDELAEAMELRGLGDLEGILEGWGATAAEHAATHGYNVDLETAGFPEYVVALHDAQIESWQAILRRIGGELVPTPVALPKPQINAVPSVQDAKTVQDLADAYQKAKWDGWSESTRSAIVPVIRVLVAAVGDRDVRSILREDARQVFETVKSLPAGIGKRKELRGLSVPAAIEKAKRLGLPLLNPNTVNRGYMVHIASMFGWAVAEDWADKNPFAKLAAVDPVAARDRRDPFTLEQLQKLFAASPWDRRPSWGMAKPGRYWVPLIALFTGMRLGEIAGLRLMDYEALEGVPALRVRPYEGRRLKNAESRRDLPVHSELIRLGLPDFIAARRKVARPGDLIFPDAKANSRSQWGARLGQWFAALVAEKGFAGTKLGMHSFRHGFEDRLKAAGLHGRAEGQALAGRRVTGSEASYGNGFTIFQLQAALETITHPGLDLKHLVPPAA